MAYSALYNPLSINIDDVGRVHSSDDRNKYPVGTIVILKETYPSNDGDLITASNGIYMWVEAANNYTKGKPFLIAPSGLQAEAQADDLVAQASGASIGFAQIDGVVAGKYFFAKLAGHIVDVDSAAGVTSGDYVKANASNDNLEQGNGAGATLDEEVVGVATSSVSGGKINISVLPNRYVKIA